MKKHELMSDGETETEPAVTPRQTAVALAKSLEDMRQQFGVDLDRKSVV